MATSTLAAGAASPEPPAQRLATEDYVARKVAELEAWLTWRLLAIAAAIVAAVKFIPPAY